MKIKDIDSSYLIKISAGYQWLLDERYDLGPNLAHAACPRWRNPVMAPVILLKRKMKSSDLQLIENHFAKKPKRHAYDTAPPSLMLYDIPFYDRLSNQRVLERAGWTEARRDLYLNVWNKQQKMMLPKGFEVTQGRYTNPRLKRDFERLSKANFGANAAFMKDLDFLHRKIEANLTITIIYEKSKIPVAAGLTFTRDQTTLLYCGSVNKNRRNKGLWKLLVAARQAVSNTGDGHIWMMSSQNEHIRTKGELSFRMRFLSKAENKST